MSILDQIQSRNDLFSEAVTRGDAAAVAALYTDDAWLLPPGAPMIRGKAGIEVFWKTQFEQVAAIDLTAVDVAPLGENSAREVGRFGLRRKGHPDVTAGKYLVVWRRLGDAWYLEVDTFNLDG